MAQFGWAYVNCNENDGSGSSGPAHSIQFVTESGGATTGSAYLTYYTGSAVSGRSEHTLYLTGTLIVTGAISASSYHIEDITQIGATGSTNFGNSNNDTHIRTGSLTVFKIPAGASDVGYILSASNHDESVRVRGFGGEYQQVISVSTYRVQSKDYIVGIAEPNTVTVTLPGPSASCAGRLIVIKDEYPGRGTGSIVITGSLDSSYIDNQVSYTMTGSLPAINLYSNGSNWFVF
jgi:hypothetical protein